MKHVRDKERFMPGSILVITSCVLWAFFAVAFVLRSGRPAPLPLIVSAMVDVQSPCIRWETH
jgi:hypothetical protein